MNFGLKVTRCIILVAILDYCRCDVIHEGEKVRNSNQLLIDENQQKVNIAFYLIHESTIFAYFEFTCDEEKWCAWRSGDWQEVPVTQ